jgi:hypothetical protein
MMNSAATTPPRQREPQPWELAEPVGVILGISEGADGPFQVCTVRVKIAVVADVSQFGLQRA